MHYFEVGATLVLMLHAPAPSLPLAVAATIFAILVESVEWSMSLAAGV